jgi:Phage portal protein
LCNLTSSITTRFKNLLGLETKGYLATPEPWFFELFGSAPASSGVIVTPRVAMTCTPVRRAVQLISESIGQLPVQVYATGNDGATNRAPDHPAYALLNDAANDWTPASKFREEITRDALLYPNGGFAYINFVDGKPFELTRFDPEINPVIVEYIGTEPFYSVGDREIAAKTNLDPDETKIALGEEGDIWPASIKPDTDEADLLEDGSTPTPDPDFITEEEDANPKGIVR